MLSSIRKGRQQKSTPHVFPDHQGPPCPLSSLDIARPVERRDRDVDSPPASEDRRWARGIELWSEVRKSARASVRAARSIMAPCLSIYQGVSEFLFLCSQAWALALLPFLQAFVVPAGTCRVDRLGRLGACPRGPKGVSWPCYLGTKLHGDHGQSFPGPIDRWDPGRHGILDALATPCSSRIGLLGRGAPHGTAPLPRFPRRLRPTDKAQLTEASEGESIPIGTPLDWDQLACGPIGPGTRSSKGHERCSDPGPTGDLFAFVPGDLHTQLDSVSKAFDKTWQRLYWTALADGRSCQLDRYGRWDH